MNPPVMQEKLGSTPQGRALLKVLNSQGGPSELAKLISVSRQTIDNWIYLSGQVSKAGAIAIESSLHGVTKEELRPDITDWSETKARAADLLSTLQETPRGRGLLAMLERVKYSRKAMATLFGLSSPHLVQTWISRGYLPKHHVQAALLMPEFKGLTAEIIRPDLHALDY